LAAAPVGDASDLVGVDAHRLLHQEGVAVVHQMERDLGHATVSAERDDEVRSRLQQHPPVVGERRWTAERRRPLGGDRGVRVVNADQLHVGHGREVAQVGGVIQRVPVTHPDGHDACRHGRQDSR
jgi:hypothetical protein